MKRFFYILSAIVFAMQASLYAQNSDTLPEPDRMAEDFVLTSVCIADPTYWQDDALGTLGHAFLRLQCPYYNLDFCFTYEGESVNDNFNKYLMGETKMGMFAYKTNEYLEDYKKWNRSVHEYHLNLPPESEVRLWEIMDNHLTKGINLTQDMNRYGCAITIVRYVKKALDTIPIVYHENELETLTRREIGYRSLANQPWQRLISMVFTDSRYDSDCPIDEKLIVPADLVQVWQNATVNGKQLAVYKQDLVSGASVDNTKPWFTPMLVALILLVIVIGFAFTDIPYLDWLLLAVQTIGGLVMFYFWIMMLHFSISGYLLMVLLNPLPVICWKWRRYWELPYAVLLLIGGIVLICMPHMIIDPAVIVFAMSYVVMYAKNPVKRFLSARR